MSNKRSRVNSIVHPTAVTPAGILTERANEVSTDLISSTNRTSNAEKLLKLLINDTIRSYDVLKRSERDGAWEQLYNKFNCDGYDRKYEYGQTKKREELFAIKAKALDYSNSVPKPTTDLTSLDNNERANLESYKFKNLSSCSNFKATLIEEEDDIIHQLNVLNTRRFNNHIKQQYLKSVFEVLNSNIKAALVAECIDGYILDCGGDTFKAKREDNLIIEDVEYEAELNLGQMQIEDKK